MKTITTYMEEQKQIQTFGDFGFSEESLINKIPSTAIMKILYYANQQIFTDGFMIQAVAEMQNAICAGATQFKVLISFGFAGDSAEAKMNPTKKIVMTYELKENKVINTKFEEYAGEDGFVKFLKEYSEQKIFLK